MADGLTRKKNTVSPKTAATGSKHSIKSQKLTPAKDKLLVNTVDTCQTRAENATGQARVIAVTGLCVHRDNHPLLVCIVLQCSLDMKRPVRFSHNCPLPPCSSIASIAEHLAKSPFRVELHQHYRSNPTGNPRQAPTASSQNSIPSDTNTSRCVACFADI